MADESRTEKMRLALATIFFIFVVYPIKYIIAPLTKILYENIYIIACLFMMWVTYLTVGSPAEANALLKQRLSEDPNQVMWIIQPFATIYGYEITPMLILTTIMILILLYRMYDIAGDVFKIVKTWAGHILMVSLWGWFTLVGDKEQSLMCIRSDTEKRTLLVFYAILITVILAVIGLTIIQNMATDQMAHILNYTSDPIVRNETIQTTANLTFVELNVTHGEVSDLVWNT